MRNRVRQVLAAITARVSVADRQYLARQLTPEEQALFYGMNLPDQRHALNVARTALQLAGDRPGVDRQLLVRCALLHDVGKMRGDVSTWDKILTVLAHQVAPLRAAAWGRPGRGGRLNNLRHAFHVYFHHPGRGAEMLTAIGAEARVVAIVRRHHEAPAVDDSPELALLRQADEQN